MSATTAGIMVIAVLCGWHLRTTRNPQWHSNRNARACVTSGYASTAVAVYFLADSADTTDGVWVLGWLWALAAMVSFVYGFQLLRSAAVPARTTATARAGSSSGATV